MAVLGGHYPRGKINAHLNDLASRDAQIAPLEIGALDSRLLCLHHLQRQTLATISTLPP
jgi:hypothetical protein